MTDNKYTIVEKLTPDHIDQLHDLYKQMWWSKDRTREEIDIMLETCMVFAAVETKTGELAGFARVLTDKIRYAYIYDVMVPENLRNIGLGKMVMNSILSHSLFKNIKYFELTCLHELADYYKKFCFNDNYGDLISMRHINVSTPYFSAP